MKKKLIIAIDGPGGSGKSTIARMVAERLGYLYVDTGAMYRAITLKAVWEGIELEDEDALTRLACQSEITLKMEGKVLKVYLDREDVSEEIRSPDLTDKISFIARSPGVREQMVAKQRAIGGNGGVVLEGRDIGTIVFPDADLKFYLDANLQERARRRYEQLREMGYTVELETIEKELKVRDEKDKTRDVAPLKIAGDAIIVDTTNMSIEEEVALIVSKVS